MKRRSTSGKSPYAVLSGVVFLAMASYSVYRVLMHQEYEGVAHSWAFDALLATVWSAAGISVLTGRPWAVYLGLMGLIATFAHSLAGAISLRWGALPYVIATLLLIVFLRKSFGLFNPSDTEHAPHRPIQRGGT